MAGKNKTEKGFRLLFDDSGGTARDLSADLVPGSLQGGGVTLDEVDMTGVSQEIRNYLAGHGDAPVTGQFHLNDTATTGAYTVLKGMTGAVGTLTLQWGSNGAAPTTNDPEWEGEYLLSQMQVQPANGAFVINARFVPSGGTDPAWGTVA